MCMAKSTKMSKQMETRQEGEEMLPLGHGSPEGKRVMKMHAMNFTW